MDRNLALEVVRVTEAAALASARLMGLGDANAADAAAVEAMRTAFDGVPINGKIVIGEGERDEAPMLYIGEKVGARTDGSTDVDIAVDPLEGTNLCATGSAGAIAVVAISERGKFLHAPDTYMEKIAVGPAGRGVISLDRTPTENLKALARAKGCLVQDLTVVILDRPRHRELIEEVRRVGARIKLITDGDVSAAIATCDERTGVDILMGIGGAPEGVLAAAALRCVGGDMFGRLKWRNDEEKKRATEMGIADQNKIYKIDELASGDVVFAATGVTSGDYLRGVRFRTGGADTHSVVMRSSSGTIRYIEAHHKFELKPNYDSNGRISKS